MLLNLFLKFFTNFIFPCYPFLYYSFVAHFLSYLFIILLFFSQSLILVHFLSLSLCILLSLLQK
ncbi:hypothetical protein C1646_681762 [Rhizophagus diaphanus]|nr:hypothetical protein C1646_681762 [Rhizophagus diaphanus] [Rhizophagus sp. MUCL 43196]